MDRAVLDAYGWTGPRRPASSCSTTRTKDEEETAAGRKKPWRYRWPDDVRDEVLARLLELNKQRAEQERLEGWQPKPPQACPRGRRKAVQHRRHGASSRPRTRHNRTCWAGEGCCGNVNHAHYCPQETPGLWARRSDAGASFAVLGRQVARQAHWQRFTEAGAYKCALVAANKTEGVVRWTYRDWHGQYRIAMATRLSHYGTLAAHRHTGPGLNLSRIWINFSETLQTGYQTRCFDPQQK